MNISLILSDIELGKTCGMSVDETGSYLGNYSGATVVGGPKGRSLAILVRSNYMRIPRQKLTSALSQIHGL